MHRNADWRVKVDQSLRLGLGLDKERVPFRIVGFEGGNHGLYEHSDEVNEQAIQWFNNYIRDCKALPNMEYHGR